LPPGHTHPNDGGEEEPVVEEVVIPIPPVEEVPVVEEVVIPVPPVL
jgi:hypothetical protein